MTPNSHSRPVTEADDVARAVAGDTAAFERLYRADPSLSLVATVSVGRGPAAMAISPDGGRIYVANYLDDTLAIVDTMPGSPTQFRVVMRMGVPRE